MTIDDKIRDEKKYDINREAAKISALSSEKNDKYEYLTGEEARTSLLILPWKSFGKTNRMIEDQGEKQTKAIEEHEKQLIKSSGEKDSVNY